MAGGEGWLNGWGTSRIHYEQRARLLHTRRLAMRWLCIPQCVLGRSLHFRATYSFGLEVSGKIFLVDQVEQCGVKHAFLLGRGPRPLSPDAALFSRSISVINPRSVNPRPACVKLAE